MTKLSINEIFEQGRTCYNFSTKPVEDSLLKEIYDLTKLGPTSANCCPLRIVFVKTPDAKEKLLSCLMEGNIEKTKSAPVTALFALDSKFFQRLPELFPLSPDFGKMYENNKEAAESTAFRNSSLQAAYFMIIARSLGLDCGPMSGFFEDKLNEEFFAGTSWKVNFICNLGYKAEDNNYPRLPRLNFDEACKII